MNKIPVTYVTVYDDEDNELELRVEYTVYPAQRGGSTDESWDAYYEIEEITLNGEDFTPNESQQQIIDDAINGE